MQARVFVTKAASLDRSATEALNALQSVRVVDIDLGDNMTKHSVTRQSQRATSLLRALIILKTHPLRVSVWYCIYATYSEDYTQSGGGTAPDLTAHPSVDREGIAPGLSRRVDR